MLIAQYHVRWYWLAPRHHVAIATLLRGVIRYGNAARRVLAAYFAAAYLWLFVVLGVWVSYRLLYIQGTEGLAFHAFTPVLTAAISAVWVKELWHPRLDLRFRSVPRWRLLFGVPAMVWRYWYLTY